MSRRSCGMRSILARLPSKYLRSEIMTESHRPRALRSRTRYGLITVNSPDRFDFTYRFWYVGSIDCDTPVMLAMVAVGAMAMMFELRMPFLTRSRTGAQSRVSSRLTSMYLAPRASIRICWEVRGGMPLDGR